MPIFHESKDVFECLASSNPGGDSSADLPQLSFTMLSQ